jgi:hypothetical protein
MRRLFLLVALLGLAPASFAKKMQHHDCHIYVHHNMYLGLEDQLEHAFRTRGYATIYYTWKDNSRDLKEESLRFEMEFFREFVTGLWPNKCYATAKIDKVIEKTKNTKKVRISTKNGELIPEFLLQSEEVARATHNQWSWGEYPIPCDAAMWHAILALPRCVAE